MNIQGAVNNFNELENIVNTNNFEFICLSETHLNENDDDNLINIENYNIIRNNTESRHTGGVLFYIKETWNFDIVKKISINLNLWWLVVRVYKNNVKIYLAALYKSPNSAYNINDFLETIEKQMEELYELNNQVIIMGDFNINWLEKSIKSTKIAQIINDMGFKQIINQPTRIYKNSKSLIDYVITNRLSEISVKINNNFKISDHESLVIDIINTEPTTINSRSLKTLKYNISSMRNLISRSNLTTKFFLPCNEKACIFSNSLKKVVSKFVVTKKISNIKSNAWFCNELALLKNSKVNQYKIAVWINNETEWENYRKIRNFYKNKLDQAKNNYVNNKIETSKDQKSMWRTIKEMVLNNNKTGNIKEIMFADGVVNDAGEIAEKFNQYFVNSIVDINSGISHMDYNDMIEYRQSVFKFERVSSESLKLCIKNMNKKKDINFVNTKLILENYDLLGENLLEIINESLETGIYPDKWKETLVIPIEKIKNSKKYNEFRPINMITCEAKIIEKIVNMQLNKYLEENNIITENQSGFRNNHSCETLLNLIIANWKVEIYNKKVIIAVFIDLKRAFETVDRKLLLKKMEKYGVRNSEYEWFKSYLHNRKQKTRVNGHVSSSIIVPLGVPQGTILGVLLFLIFINDIEKAVKYSKILLFADDALMYFVSDSIDDCVCKINEDLNLLNGWMKMNKLSLNVAKTKAMCLNGILNADILIENVQIDIVNEIKYLGIIIDDKLNFKSNIDYICKKVAKKLSFFKNIRNKVSTKCAINIYNTIIKQNFEYCSTITAFTTNECLVRLQKLQNWGMRIILKLNRYSSVNVMLRTLKWLNIHQIMKLNVLVFVFKMKNGLLPHYLTRNLTLVQDVHHYHLRNIFNFRLNFFRNENVKKNVMYNGLKWFNDLPNNIKNEKNLREFKKLLINHI